jgi:DNA processing protein
VSAVAGPERQARAALSFLAEPGDPALGALLGSCGPAEIVAAVSHSPDPRTALPAAVRGIPGIGRAIDLWRARLGQVPTAARLAAWERGGLRLLCPGEPEWPTQLDDLGDARPVVLWLRGTADLRYACLRSLSVVGSRAATAYGTHVGTELAAGLAERGYTVISGGAYGIDSCAHRAAMSADGLTIAVLASGLSYCYPRGHPAGIMSCSLLSPLAVW